MNYIKLDFVKVEGYDKLTPRAKELFKAVYIRHNSIQGNDYKKNWIPKKVEECKRFLKVHFVNGQWLHYCPNGTWY